MDKMKTLFLRSLDSEISNDEKAELEKALENSLELQNYRDQILDIRLHLRSLKNSIQTNDFTDRVMNNVHNKNRVESAMVYSMEQVFKKISYVAAAVLLFMFAYNAYTSEDFNANSLIGLQEITIEQEFEDAIASVD